MLPDRADIQSHVHSATMYIQSPGCRLQTTYLNDNGEEAIA
jgi:hypothetical protein